MAVHDVQSQSNWKMAIDSYLSRLKPEQAAAFKAPSSLQECLDVLVKTESKRPRMSRITGLFQPLIDPLKRFEGAIDVLVQTNAGIAAPIWGPLRIAFTVASEHYRTIESLAMLLYRILGSIDRYTHYERIFECDQRVQNAVGALYADLIDFCSRVVKFYSRKFRSVFYSFDREFGLVAERTSYHSSQVDQAANAAHITSAKESQETSAQLRQIRDRMTVLRWLSPSTVEDDLHRYSCSCMAGSCDPVINSPWFEAFVKQPEPQTYRLVGRPGSGKTILTAFIAEHLSKCPKDIVVFFFCKAQDSTKNRSNYVLRTLLAQLIQSEEGLYESMLELLGQDGREEAVSSVSITRALKIAFEKLSKSQVFIIIDALDECQDPQDLVAAIDLYTGGKARILVTSRAVSAFDPLFKNTVSIDTQMNSSDAIRKYVYERTKPLKQLRGSQLDQKVIQEVCRASNGLWLFAKLMMDEVSKAPSPVAISCMLSKVPHGLTQLYDSIMENLVSRFTPEQILLAQQALLWMDVRDYMNPALVSENDLLESHTLKLGLQFANNGDPVFDEVELTRDLCGPLVEMYGGSRGTELSMVHLSAYQHLAESSVREPHLIPTLLMPQRLRELHRAATAVWYFTSYDGFKPHLEELIETALEGSNEVASTVGFTGGAFEMSYGLWNAFTMHDLPATLGEQEKAEATRLLQNLMDFLTSSKCLGWIEHSIVHNLAGGWMKLSIENAQRARSAALRTSCMPDFVPLQQFKHTCQKFFHIYIEILQALELEADPYHSEDSPYGSKHESSTNSKEILEREGAERRNEPKENTPGGMEPMPYKSQPTSEKEQSDTSPSTSLDALTVGGRFHSEWDRVAKNLYKQPEDSVYRSIYAIARQWSHVFGTDPLVIGEGEDSWAGGAVEADGPASQAPLTHECSDCKEVRRMRRYQLSSSGSGGPWMCPTKACKFRGVGFQSEAELEWHFSCQHAIRWKWYRWHYFGPVCKRCLVKLRMQRRVADES